MDFKMCLDVQGPQIGVTIWQKKDQELQGTPHM